MSSPSTSAVGPSRLKRSFLPPPPTRTQRKSRAHNKNSPATINMQTSSAKAARKSRIKLRKRKFLSLRLELSPPTTATAASSAGMSPGDRPSRKQSTRNQISPLVDDLEIRDDENLAADFLFNGDDKSVTTLSGLLNGAAETAYSPVDAVGSLDSVSTQLREAIDYRDRRSRSSLFLRAAMKSGGLRETEKGEERVEKWVCYREVVERKVQEDEVSSCTASTDSSGVRPRQRGLEEEGPLLRLKLDYEEVLNSWPSNKGSLFIHGDRFSDDRHHYHQPPPPQTVPELIGESIPRDSEHMDGLGTSVNNIWSVPEDQKPNIKMEDKDQDWFRQREASVLRYKEKRQNRLFDKQIRYEVRKLNTEKLP